MNNYIREIDEFFDAETIKNLQRLVEKAIAEIHNNPEMYYSKDVEGFIYYLLTYPEYHTVYDIFGITKIEEEEGLIDIEDEIIDQVNSKLNEVLVLPKGASVFMGRLEFYSNLGFILFYENPDIAPRVGTKKCSHGIYTYSGTKKIADVHTDIEQEKNKLIAKAKRRGLYENFGQDEVRKLEDKYRDHQYKQDGVWDAIRRFSEWAMNFDLSQVN